MREVIPLPVEMPPPLPYGSQPPGLPVPTPRIGDDAGIRMLLPVGRSGWAIAAGYLGLFGDGPSRRPAGTGGAFPGPPPVIARHSDTAEDSGSGGAQERLRCKTPSRSTTLACYRPSRSTRCRRGSHRGSSRLPIFTQTPLDLAACLSLAVLATAAPASDQPSRSSRGISSRCPCSLWW